jgi:hypothetical protein
MQIGEMNRNNITMTGESNGQMDNAFSLCGNGIWIERR